jgi:hypothetical protein
VVVLPHPHLFILDSERKHQAIILMLPFRIQDEEVRMRKDNHASIRRTTTQASGYSSDACVVVLPHPHLFILDSERKKLPNRVIILQQLNKFIFRLFPMQIVN